MTIYIDIILLENLCMNYIMLFATGLINKVQIKKMKILLSSLLGATYAVVSMLNIIQAYSSLILKILLSIAMIYLAFSPKNIKLLFRQLIIFYLVSFAFGGCAFALLYFVKPEEILIRNGVFIGTYPIKIAIMGGILGFLIVNIAFKSIKKKFTKEDLFCNVIIRFEEKEINVKALIDTGNLLKDPISGLPVIVVEKTKVEEIIPKYVLKNFNKTLGGEDNVNIEDKYISRFRVIPFSSLGKQNGLLLGFKADEVKIETDETTRNISNVIIGIYEKSLTKNGAYTGLIGLNSLEGCDKNELFENIKG